MGKFYKEFALKKVLECEGLEFLKNVKVGTEVYLKNDLDNKKFKGLTNQVGITKEEGKGNVIGVIPEEEGRLIKDILDMGWNKLFKANAARKSKVDDNTARMQSIKQLGV